MLSKVSLITFFSLIVSAYCKHEMIAPSDQFVNSYDYFDQYKTWNTQLHRIVSPIKPKRFIRAMNIKESDPIDDSVSSISSSAFTKNGLSKVKSEKSFSVTKKGNVIEVTSSIGGMAQLPCNITKGIKDDSIRLILWFKDSLPGGPIYSIDSRNSNLSLAKHFSTIESIGVRASFDLTTNPSYLILDPLREEDIGEYKCRVDFVEGRTLTTIVKLNIIVPPSSVWITDSNGRTLESWSGPYDELSDIHLSCLSKGGTPLPSLVWFLNGQLLDQSYLIEESNKTVTNRLEIYNVSRDYLNSVLVCKAINQLYPTSINASITLDINLKPLSVKLIPLTRTLLAGQRADITCESMYSRPPAVLTWLKNKKKLLDESETITESGNKTTSVLNFVPSPEDNGLYLICKAENIRLKNSAIEDKLLLYVRFAPITSLVMVNHHHSNSLVKTGDHIGLHCQTKSNPEVSEYSWSFQGKLIDQVTMKKFKINGSVLSIESASKEDSGSYKCSAKNEIGFSESENFHLKVHYLPVCTENQKITYGIGLRETARILCVVDASPETNVTFTWTFANNSQLPLTSKYPTNVEGLRSSILFTPFNLHDYGYIQCWAKNTIGRQEKPCTFNIVPADRPDSPNRCKKYEINDTTMKICCDPGYDGGLTQKIHLEVYKGDKSDFNVIANVTSSELTLSTLLPSPPPSSLSSSSSPPTSSSSSTPICLFIDNLIPSEFYTFIVYSSNIKGKSGKSFELEGTKQTTKQLPLEKGSKNNSTMSSSSMVTITFVLVIISSLLIVIILKRRSRSTKLLPKPEMDINTYSPSFKRSPSQLNLEAKSPDIIPLPRTSIDFETETFWANLESKNDRRAIYISCKEGDSMAIPLKRIPYNSIISAEPAIEMMTMPYMSNV
ncbi:nephrin-like isoform X2 [Panonychus citri]|uniref:nephrin-like isoform X2 n=1 Tax=Panonychus citri TaxID=50023 RepID=UPI00230812DE|nr:nephrin-like isoform X2 [Panonychus citri]